MILKLQKSQPVPDVCVIEFFGKLIMSNESRQVEWVLAEQLVGGVKRIIFDLSRLDGIDSTGVGIIVMCEGKVRKAGGELRVAGPAGIVGDTLRLTRVDRLVRCFPNTSEAMRDFSLAANQAS
jgi:anti-sigma B factor antagonist